jgi:hypothetical protein
MTGSSVLVAAEDPSRGALLLMNCSAHDISFVFAPLGTTSAPTVTAGAAGVFTLAAAASAGKMGGSYEPDAGFIPTNAIYANGTNNDILVCYISQAPV